MADNSADIAKRVILGAVAEGMTVEAATASAGKSIKTYEYYRRTDKVFADKPKNTSAPFIASSKVLSFVSAAWADLN